jgi:membrane-associated phospholipid phosphatase
MDNRRSFQYWLLGLAICIVSVIVCVIYVDRPVAEFVNRNLRPTAIFLMFGRALRPLIVVVPIGLLYLVGSGCWVIAGRRLSSWTRTLLLCSWSLVWALAATVVLKQIFGRTSALHYIQHDVYGFYPLRGGPVDDAFPSGTAAIATAIIAVLWLLVPRLRTLWALTLVLIAVALVVTNNHFVADVIGGSFLGGSIGWMTVRLQRPPEI